MFSHQDLKLGDNSTLMFINKSGTIETLYVQIVLLLDGYGATDHTEWDGCMIAY